MLVIKASVIRSRIAVSHNPLMRAEAVMTVMLVPEQTPVIWGHALEPIQLSALHRINVIPQEYAIQQTEVARILRKQIILLVTIMTLVLKQMNVCPELARE